MAHIHDEQCRWCRAVLFTPWPANHEEWPGHQRQFLHTACPAKPPMTPEEGAAVVCGLILMAEAIRAMPRCERCGFYCFRTSAGCPADRLATLKRSTTT